MAKVKNVESQVDGEQSQVIVLDDGTEVSLSDLDGGFMRQSDYTTKTQALAEQRKTLEQANASQQAHEAIDSQAQGNDGSAKVEKMYLDMQMQNMKNVYGDEFDEVAVLNKAQSMLKNGADPTDIDFDFIHRGLTGRADESAMKEQIRKELLAEFAQNDIDTSSIISSMDGSAGGDPYNGLTKQERDFCDATRTSYADYAKYK